MIAIHGLDNAVEYLLRIIVGHLDIETATGKNLDTAELSALAGEVNRYLSDTYSIKLPYLSDVKMLRQVRNLVQHGVVDPRADIDRFRRVVERLYKVCFATLFGLDPDTMRLSQMIEDQLIRNHLENAENAIDAGDLLRLLSHPEMRLRTRSIEVLSSPIL